MRPFQPFSLLVAGLLAFSITARHTVTETLTTFITVTSSSTVTAASSPAPTTSPTTSPTTPSSIDPSLVPPFGVTPGTLLNDGTPRCAGLDGKPIDCDCPPDLSAFLSAVYNAVADGAAFPPSNSPNDQLARLNTCITVLQNIRGGPGSGQGCPAVSTNWGELQGQLTSEVNR